MESVYELPESFDWSPRGVLNYINARWPEADEDEQCVLFDLARGLYWFCVEWHGGQWCDLYAVSCALDYRPSACEGSPVDEDGEWTGDDDDEAPAYVYAQIQGAA